MIDNIRIASPCTADWEQMQGDNRVRHCDACNLNVYNLAAFTDSEIRIWWRTAKGDCADESISAGMEPC